VVIETWVNKYLGRIGKSLGGLDSPISYKPLQYHSTHLGGRCATQDPGHWGWGIEIPVYQRRLFEEVNPWESEFPWSGNGVIPAPAR
jgi:hypothetical protein